MSEYVTLYIDVPGPKELIKRLAKNTQRLGDAGSGEGAVMSNDFVVAFKNL